MNSSSQGFICRSWNLFFVFIKLNIKFYPYPPSTIYKFISRQKSFFKYRGRGGPGGHLKHTSGPWQTWSVLRMTLCLVWPTFCMVQPSFCAVWPAFWAMCLTFCMSNTNFLKVFWSFQKEKYTFFKCAKKLV